MMERLKKAIGRRLIRRGARMAGFIDDIRHRSWVEPATQTASFAGVRVTPETAMRSSAVSACIRILSSTVAMLPMFVYERTTVRQKPAKRRAENHPAYQLLHDRPNEYQTPYEFKQEIAAQLAARGNAYIEKISGTELWPIHPDHVRPDWFDRKSGRRRVYDISSQHDGTGRVLTDDLMWHPHLLSLDGGLSGASPVMLAVDGIGTALAAQVHTARFYGAGAQLMGFLKTEGNLDESEVTAIEDKWSQAYGGPFMAWKTPVLHGDLDYKPVSITAKDAQLVEFMKWTVADLARVWGIPLALLQETEKSTSWGTGIEQFLIALKTFTLAPYLCMLQQSAGGSLITQPRRFFAEFKADALVWADLHSRYEAYSMMANSNIPILTRNEMRANENLDPDPNPESDEFPKPVNVQSSGANGSAAHALETLAAFLESEVARHSNEMREQA